MLSILSSTWRALWELVYFNKDALKQLKFFLLSFFFVVTPKLWPWLPLERWMLNLLSLITSNLSSHLKLLKLLELVQEELSKLWFIAMRIIRWNNNVLEHNSKMVLFCNNHWTQWKHAYTRGKIITMFARSSWFFCSWCWRSNHANI